MSTISKLFEVYLSLRPDLAAGTVEIYRYAIRRLIDACGDRAAGDLTSMDAMRYAAGLAGALSPTSANMYLRAAKAFFRWLVAAEAIGRTPFAAVKPLKAPPPGRVMYKQAEIEQMLAACPTDRWRLIVALAATAGLRRGEVLNLTVAEIDYAAGVIRLAAKADTAATWAWRIKDGDGRAVPITPLAELYLLRAHAALPDGQPYICLRPERWRRVIAKRNRLGHLPHVDTICPEINFLRTFRTICGRAGVAYRTFHALRGSALSIMAKNGLQPHEIQAIGGHADVRTTYQHYVRPDGHLDRARSAAFRPQNWAVQDLNL